MNEIYCCFSFEGTLGRPLFESHFLRLLPQLTALWVTTATYLKPNMLRATNTMRHGRRLIGLQWQELFLKFLSFHLCTDPGSPAMTALALKMPCQQPTAR